MTSLNITPGARERKLGTASSPTLRNRGTALPTVEGKTNHFTVSYIYSVKASLLPCKPGAFSLPFGSYVHMYQPNFPPGSSHAALLANLPRIRPLQGYQAAARGSSPPLRGSGSPPPPLRILAPREIAEAVPVAASLPILRVGLGARFWTHASVLLLLFFSSCLSRSPSLPPSLLSSLDDFRGNSALQASVLLSSRTLLGQKVGSYVPSTYPTRTPSPSKPPSALSSSPPPE